ncbi:uncharacterized protein LOC141892348 isoform X2 [Acropora palmata]|uniref:uncharacterized protein LOC141892348 isoform X2 n=1 Tax=Acropora palmata TaxID=6131 RepID=UPI003DA010CE
MTSGPAAIVSTRENTNYSRLCRLLVDVGSQVLCDTFNTIHPRSKLSDILSSPPVKHALQSLRDKRVLNATQWGKLYPTPTSAVSSSNFDITLLVILLRNICHLTPPRSTKSWDKLPPASDNGTEDNIARIKYYRNHVYGHTPKASVDDPTFNMLWQEISNAILSLEEKYEPLINRLKTESMDPDEEKHYQGLLKEWKEDDNNTKEKLDGIEEMMKSLQGSISEMPEKMREMMKSHQDSTNEKFEESKVVPVGQTVGNVVPDAICQYLANHISTKWKRLGIQLSIGIDVLNSIDHENSLVWEKSIMMLKTWKEKFDDKATVEVLRKALENIERNDLSKEVRDKMLEMPQQTSPLIEGPAPGNTVTGSADSSWQSGFDASLSLNGTTPIQTLTEPESSQMTQFTRPESATAASSSCSPSLVVPVGQTIGNVVPDAICQYLANHISTKWKRLGIQLSIGINVLNSIDHENSLVWEKSIMMLKTWKEKFDDKATVEVLRKALENIGRNDLSKEVRDKMLEIPEQTPPPIEGPAPWNTVTGSAHSSWQSEFDASLSLMGTTPIQTLTEPESSQVTQFTPPESATAASFSYSPSLVVPEGQTVGNVVPDAICQYLANHISTKWKRLGIQLSIGIDVLNSIDHENRLVWEKSIMMLKTWKEKFDDKATVEVLRKALENIGRNDLSKEVRDKMLEMPEQTSPPIEGPAPPNIVTGYTRSSLQSGSDASPSLMGTTPSQTLTEPESSQMNHFPRPFCKFL